MMRKLFCITAIALLISGCGNKTFDFKIRYMEINGLKNGDHITYENKILGNVANVTYTENGDYIVEASIQNEYANLITTHSTFFIDSVPGEEGRKTVVMKRTQSGGTQIQAGQIIEGTAKILALFGQIQRDLEKKISSFRTEFNDFLDALQNLSESEQIKKIERELDLIIEDMTQFSESMREKMRDDMLPQIQKRIEELRKKLKELNREDELKPIEKKIEKISNEIRT